MKTLERTTTPASDEAPAPRRLKLREGALTPGGAKAVHHEADGSTSLVDAVEYKAKYGKAADAFADIVKTSLSDVEESSDEIIAKKAAEDPTRAHFAEILSQETLDAEEADTPEQQEKLSLRKRIGKKLGSFVARANYGYAALFQKLGERQQKSIEKDKARRKKYEKQDGDSRRTRIRKFMGRNGAMLAAGATLGGLTAATLAARYMNVELGNGGAAAAAHDTIVQHGEIAPTAQTQILVGGRGMPDGNAMRPIANSLGLRGEKTIGIQYPAEIRTWVTPGDRHTLDESSAISAQKVYDAYQANKNGTVEIVGYSEGTQGVQDALDRIASENGGRVPDNVSVKIIASPNTAESGVFNDPKAQALKPLFLANGANMDRTIAPGENVMVIAMDTDFWANAGNRPPSTMISQAIGLVGDGHRAPTAGMRYDEHVKDGITYRTYYHDGTQNAALRVAEQHGFHVTKKADEFASALAPTGELGKSDVRVDAGEVLRTGAAAAEEALTANGVNPQHAQAVQSVIETIPVAPVQQVFDAAHNIPNQLAEAPQVQAVVQQAAPVLKQAAPAIDNAVRGAANQLGIRLP